MGWFAFLGVDVDSRLRVALLGQDRDVARQLERRYGEMIRLSVSAPDIAGFPEVPAAGEASALSRAAR